MNLQPSKTGATENGLSERQVLRLRQGITIVPGSDQHPDTTWVMVNSRVLRLRGESARRILAAIDGTRTLEEIGAALGGASPTEVGAVVDRLRRSGLLEPEGSGSFAMPASLVRALSDQGADGVAVAAEMARARVAVVGEGVSSCIVAGALERAGCGRILPVAPQAGDEDAPPTGLAEADVAVVALDGSDPDTLARFNRIALRLDLPWILQEAYGFEIRVGPFFLPRQTACWNCYERRLEANAPGSMERRAIRAAQRSHGGRQALADDIPPGVAMAGAEVCAVEIVRFFASRVSDITPELYGAFADYSLLTHRATPHRVLRLPRCPACGVRASGLPTVRAWMEPYDYREAD